VVIFVNHYVILDHVLIVWNKLKNSVDANKINLLLFVLNKLFVEIFAIKY